jgi:hypothetical protein
MTPYTWPDDDETTEVTYSTLLPATPVVLDARYAIAVLSVHCILNPCHEVQYVAAGQRIYPRQEGVPCTTISGVAVVGHGERYVYCRLDQVAVSVPLSEEHEHKGFSSAQKQALNSHTYSGCCLNSTY